MPGTRLTLKERKEKDKEKLKDLYNNYVSSRKKVNTLEKRKTATICFNGSYDELVELMEIKKQTLKEIEKDLVKERGNMYWFWNKYKYLKHAVDMQTTVDNTKEEIKEMKKEESALTKANKKLAEGFDINMLDRLPIELVDIIESFIPYEVRNVLIEERKPFRLFKNLTTHTIKSFLMNICYTAEYFSLLSEEEKQSYIYKPENNPHAYLPNLQNPHYGHFTWNPDWLQYNKKKDIETRIKYIFHIFKLRCPKGAYKLMRMFLVLIKPDKKYNKYDGSWTRLTSIPV
jgi:hypothetical protein